MGVSKVLDKQRQYFTVYVPEDKLDLKDEAYDALLDIDSNFSDILMRLLPSLLHVAKLVSKEDKNINHYNYYIGILKKE